MKLVLKNYWKIIEELTQCGNYGNLLLHLFDKNFVKVTEEVTKELISLKKFSKREFVMFQHSGGRKSLSPKYFS